MSVVLNNPSFHESLGTYFDPHQHNHRHVHSPSHHLSPPHHQFPARTSAGGRDNFLLNGKSPRLISASWETLERLPRMSPPTSESITSHLLSSTGSSSPTSAAAAAAAAYYDYSFFYKVICTPEFLKSAKDNYIQPMLDTEFNQIVLPVECGKNCAFMYLTRLCQGSKGPCILFNACYWLTPNEFQSISGRNSAKDWKRSIRHNGKSIKLLINKGILTVHSPLCDCAYGSGIEPFVEKYSAASASPPIIASPTTSLDARVHPYGIVDSECSHSDGGSGTGGSEDDPDNDENISSSTNSDACGDESGKHYGKHVNTEDDDEEKIDVVETTTGLEDEERNSSFCTSATASSSRNTPYHSTVAAVGIAAAAESQGEESSLSVSNNNSSKNNGEQSNGNSSSGNERGSSGSGSTPTTHKSKRKPSTKQVHQHKPSTEQQSPTHLSSTTSSPPMTPPPLPPPQSSSSQSAAEGERTSRGGSGSNSHNNINGNAGGSSPPQQPIKQMEQMMSASGRNYSEFMRSLAAKYNHQQSNHNNDYFPNLSFDTRFLKPSAAAAFLNLSQLPSPVLLDKDKFPLIDMSSTQTLLSMVRSASAAAAAAAAVNNNNNNNTSNHNNNNNDCFSTKSGSGGTKRPNSPLDLSSRDIPPLKKGKLKTSSSPLDLMMQNKPSIMMAAAAAVGATGQMGQGLGAQTVCMSSCASGCSEEAQIMINWSVDEVCQFVASIDLCKDYVEVFRDHSIDGSSLPLLTEEHLMTAMNMKLGPALKFRSTIAKRLGNCVICSHCTHCHNHNNN